MIIRNVKLSVQYIDAMRETRDYSSIKSQFKA